jgi:hypothetical protein
MSNPVVFPEGYALQTGRLCAFLINVASDMCQQWMRSGALPPANFKWTPHDPCPITNRAYGVGQFEFGPIIWSTFSHLEKSHTEPFGFIAKDLASAEAAQRYLVFRGSQTKVDFDMDGEDRLVSYSAPTVDLPSVPKVADGFQQVFAGLESALSGQLEALSGTAITITGHSLGSTLATLAVPLAVSRRLTVQHYNQASPRVGDKAFADYYGGLGVPSFRLVNTADTVPKLPIGWAYAAVGSEASFTAAYDTEAQKHSPCCSYAYALFHPEDPYNQDIAVCMSELGGDA